MRISHIIMTIPEPSPNTDTNMLSVRAGLVEELSTNQFLYCDKGLGFLA